MYNFLGKEKCIAISNDHKVCTGISLQLVFYFDQQKYLSTIIWKDKWRNIQYNKDI